MKISAWSGHQSFTSTNSTRHSSWTPKPQHAQLHRSFTWICQRAHATLFSLPLLSYLDIQRNLVRDDLKLPDDGGGIPKSLGKGWQFESRLWNLLSTWRNNLPCGQLPPVLWPSPVGLLTQKKKRKKRHTEESKTCPSQDPPRTKHCPPLPQFSTSLLKMLGNAWPVNVSLY